jgi:hypothetical protein
MMMREIKILFIPEIRERKWNSEKTSETTG